MVCSTRWKRLKQCRSVPPVPPQYALNRVQAHITNWSASFDEYRRDTYRIGSGQVNNGAVLLLAL
jgi:hypothetical protein